jgi:hypothetical protein
MFFPSKMIRIESKTMGSKFANWTIFWEEVSQINLFEKYSKLWFYFFTYIKLSYLTSKHFLTEGIYAVVCLTLTLFCMLLYDWTSLNHWFESVSKRNTVCLFHLIFISNFTMQSAKKVKTVVSVERRKKEKHRSPTADTYTYMLIETVKQPQSRLFQRLMQTGGWGSPFIRFTKPWS